MADPLDVTLYDEELQEEIALTAALMAEAIESREGELSQDRIDAILRGSAQ